MAKQCVSSPMGRKESALSTEQIGAEPMLCSDMVSISSEEIKLGRGTVSVYIWKKVMEIKNGTFSVTASP